MPAVNFAVYALQGKSLQAAKAYYILLEKAHSANPVNWHGKPLPDIRKLAEDIDQKFTRDLRSGNPQLLQALGLDHEAVQIQGYKDGYPRAYKDRPACYIGSLKPLKIYMYCPIDYKDEHFIPEDAVLQTEEQSEKIGQFLWAGGWSSPITVISSNRAGTALPSDFDPAKHIVLDTHHLASDANKPYRFFRAGGQSLAALNGLDQAKENYRKKTDQLFRAIESLKTDLLEAGAIKGVNAASEFYFNFSLGADSAGRPALQISARREGTGEPLNIGHNPWFKAYGKAGGDYFVDPDTGNTNGLALKAFFDAVPDRPDEHAFPKELLNQETVTPVDNLDGMFTPLDKPLIRHFPDGIYLAYRVDAGSTFVPPGCTEISQAEFLWKDADENDRNMGIIPPPPPFPPAPKAPDRKLDI